MADFWSVARASKTQRGCHKTFVWELAPERLEAGKSREYHSPADLGATSTRSKELKTRLIFELGGTGKSPPELRLSFAECLEIELSAECHDFNIQFKNM